MNLRILWQPFATEDQHEVDELPLHNVETKPGEDDIP